MLPQLEQGPLYNAINFANTGAAANPTFNGANGYPPNTTVFSVTIAGLICPSDADRLTTPYGRVNYSGNAGNAPESFFNTNGDTASNGMFFSVANGSKTIKLVDVLDGLSNTAAFSEKVKGIGNNTNTYDTYKPFSQQITVALPATGKGNDDNPTQYYKACLAAPPTPTAPLASSFTGTGSFWFDGHPENGMYNHVMLPNTWTCSNGNINDAGAFPASSRHAGGVNMLMGDGSVRFIKSTISTAPWWAIGTRLGAEVVDNNSY